MKRSEREPSLRYAVTLTQNAQVWSRLYSKRLEGNCNVQLCQFAINSS